MLSGSISTVLSEYDKLGTNGTSGSQQGGSGSEDPIYSDPQDPFQVYTQARNNEARKALLPQLMTQLVFSEDGQALIQQQGEQVQQSVVNTIESTQALVQLSAASKEQATAGAEIADLCWGDGPESPNPQIFPSGPQVPHRSKQPDGPRDGYEWSLAQQRGIGLLA